MLSSFIEEKNYWRDVLLIMQMEFSFGPKRWLPKEQLLDKNEDADVYSLGLHAPGFFDKVLNVDKCFLQSEPANKVIIY